MTLGADPREAEEFLARHPEIEAVDLVLIDVNGIGRGKIIRRHELAGLYHDGRHLPSSILGLDVTGEDVDGTGLVWEVGDADLRAWPVSGTLVPLPWTAPARAQVFVTMHGLDGSAAGCDPRHALARQAEALRARGLRANAAFECEFYLLDPEPGPDGRPRPARRQLDGRRMDDVQVYGLDDLDAMQPLFADIYDAAAAQALPLETLIAEYAPGQFELTLRYREDVMRAADDLAMLKRLVRGVARRYGTQACFMAKPFAELAGSGMHLHLSLSDADGRNIFAEPDGAEGHTPSLLHATGGLLDCLLDSMLAFAPHANSWRRFAARSYAPSAATWGVNTRDVALRVPAGPAAARRVEHRLAGVDANPYLVATLALAGMRHGLETAANPGPPASPGAETVGGRPLPPDWRAAIALARSSSWLSGALGPDLHRSFTAIKEAEYSRIAAAVPDLDYRLYLHTV